MIRGPVHSGILGRATLLTNFNVENYQEGSCTRELFFGLLVSLCC